MGWTCWNCKISTEGKCSCLDVNVDFVGRNGIEDMSMLVKRLVNNINLPLMLDSTDYEKMESGLKHAVENVF